MSEQFGAYTDHFDILSISGMSDILSLVNSSNNPRSQERANAQDENGDVAASAYYGNTDKAIEEISSTFAVVAGTLDLSDLELGELTAGVVAESLEITTSNGEWPQLTISGHKGLQTIVAPTGLLNTFELPAIEVIAAKRAQGLGFTVSAGRLTGSSLSASVELAEQQDGDGEPAAHGVSGGEGEVTADFVRVTTAPAWELTAVLNDTPAPLLEKFLGEITKEPGAEEGQAAWHTSSATAAFIVPRKSSA